MKKNLLISVLMTIVTTILLGIIYPLVVTGLAQLIFPGKANGQLIARDGKIIGSRIIGQPFNGPKLLSTRGLQSRRHWLYDAANSAGTNLGPTNKLLVTRVEQDTAALQAENPKHASTRRPWSPHPLQVSILTSRWRRQNSRCHASLRERHLAADRVRQLIAQAYARTSAWISGGAARECAGAESGTRPAGEPLSLRLTSSNLL